MSNEQIDLSGDGAAYLRISDDDHTATRQYGPINAFLAKHNAAIAKEYWFVDEGWQRHVADKRPRFQTLLKLAEAGKIKWIVVAKRDRFGTEGADELMHYRYLLRKWGCRLYDASGMDWTADNIATMIHSVFEGERSKEEQHHTSKRVTDKFGDLARQGIWNGGPIRLGFDVACFAYAEPNKERWRVIIEDFDSSKGEQPKRLKIYPDGHTERCDGTKGFPPHSKKIEFMQLVPSLDKARIAAVVSVFERYASESIAPASLARYLNERGFHSCQGGQFQGCQIEEMLQDPAYSGYPVWNRQRHGEFYAHDGMQAVLEPNKDKKQFRNPKERWVHSQQQLFPPLVDPKLFVAVQEKLEKRQKRSNAPRSARYYLSRLLHCANCGAKMGGLPSTTGKVTYACGTYLWYSRKQRAKDSPCRRNTISQDELEPYINRYLEDIGERLDIILAPPDDAVLSRLDQENDDTMRAFWDGVERLCDYLRRYHPQEYATIQREQHEREIMEQRIQEEVQRHPNRPPLPPGSVADWYRRKYGQQFLDDIKKSIPAMLKRPECASDHSDYVADILRAYRQHFNKDELREKIAQLDAEHTVLTEECMKLEAPLAIAKANKKIAALEKQLADLQAQQEDITEIVELHYRRLSDLQSAIVAAKMEMTSQRGESSWRRRAKLVSEAVQRIECSFSTEGIDHRRSRGRRQSQWTHVTFYPHLTEHLGEPITYEVDSASGADSGRTILPYSGVSRR
jgi:DNA invertase Pin-like site-specific DNA recombinase